MNSGVLHFFNDMVGKSAVMDGVAKFLIQGSMVIIPLVLVLVFLLGIFLKREKYRIVAINTLGIIIICLLVGYGIGHSVNETRPMFALAHVNILLPHANDSSFPSDHTLLCFGAAFGFYLLSRKLGVVLTIFGVLVGLAKIYAAQHYPWDILLTIVVVFAIFVLYRIFALRPVSWLYTTVERRVLPSLHKPAA